MAIAEGWLQPFDDYIPDIETWKKAYPDGAFVEGVNVFNGKTYGFTLLGPSGATTTRCCSTRR